MLSLILSKVVCDHPGRVEEYLLSEHLELQVKKCNELSFKLFFIRYRSAWWDESLKFNLMPIAMHGYQTRSKT